MSGRDGENAVVDQAPRRRTGRGAGGGALAAALGLVWLAQALGATAALGKVGPPDTRLTSVTISQLYREASFAFKALGEASRFQCKFDPRHRQVGWERCSSPRRYRHLDPGRYAFAVRAVGPGGKDPRPARRKLRIVRPPDPVAARFLTATNRDELVRLAVRDACLFAASQPDELRDMVLDFGGPRAYADGSYGALVNHVYEARNADILAALEAAAQAYAYCHQRGEAQIIYAVTNHFSTERNAAQAAAIGADQARTVSALREFQRQSSYATQRAGVAGDIEMSWWGPAESGEMVAGAKATWPHGYVDFGTAGGCPPLGPWPACANGWDLGEVGNVAYAGGGQPLPEVYLLDNPDEAAQWVSVASYWNQHNPRGFRFFGATGSTAFGELTPQQSWLVLRDETDAPLRPELIDFQVDPPLAAGRQQARQTAPERPLRAGDRTRLRQGPRKPARSLRRAGLPRRDIRSLSQARRHPGEARFPPLRGSRCPGEIVAGPEPLFSSDLLWPLRNAWQACNPHGFVAVQAGAYAPDHGTGALGIFRESYVTARQGGKVVKVPGAGALRIVKAPLGASVERWAQDRGEIEFVGERGVRGVLHLRDDTVTIER